MARIRSIKIGFFRNEILASLPFQHRLLFEGLWLLAYHRQPFHTEPPTSAELARYRCDGAGWGYTPTESLLYCRRGLSDLQAKGLVEHVPHGNRRCRVSGRTCCTWRLTQR